MYEIKENSGQFEFGSRVSYEFSWAGIDLAVALTPCCCFQESEAGLMVVCLLSELVCFHYVLLV